MVLLREKRMGFCGKGQVSAVKYDFHSIISRQGRDALAVDGIGGCWWGYEPAAPKAGFDVIPMWVADMNFPTVSTIPEAVIERVKHPLYGYFQPPKEYFDAIFRWQEQQNGVSELFSEYIGYENGILGGIASALNALCLRGDPILVHTPTYVGFTNVLRDNGYSLVHSALTLDKNNVWRMDFTDMEQKIVRNRIHVLIFCSPHNPCGRVWERWELERMMELCKKYDVYVISDEIWSDLTLASYQHIPTQSVSEDAKQRTVALYAPSKTFNLAGLVGGYRIVYNQQLRERIEKASALSYYNNMNVLSMHALMGAYTLEGMRWLKELRQVLTQNVEYACAFIAEHFDGVSVSRPQGTYMLFPDCSGWCLKHRESMDNLVKAGWDVGVAWQDGRTLQSANHVRINLALPFTQVKEAFERMSRYVFTE